LAQVITYFRKNKKEGRLLMVMIEAVIAVAAVAPKAWTKPKAVTIIITTCQ
jgi:hypothetical protein